MRLNFGCEWTVTRFRESTNDPGAQYRKNELKQGYTRRELAADFVIHVKGIVLSVVGVTLLLARVATNPSSGSAVVGVGGAS